MVILVKLADERSRLSDVGECFGIFLRGGIVGW